MPHGTPDWGHTGPKDTVFGLDDLGEHAVRLGSPVVWDRRGDVIFQTDFRDGLGDVRFFGSGAGQANGLWTGQARKGAFCVWLTAGSTLDGYRGLLKPIPFPTLGYCGVEASWSFTANTSYIELIWDIRMAADSPQPTLRVDPNTGLLECRMTVAAWHTISTTAFPYQATRCVNTMKMVFDLANRVYVRAILNEVEYPVPNVPIYVGPVAGVPFASVEFRHYGDGGTNPTGLVDCFIITQNEP